MAQIKVMTVGVGGGLCPGINNVVKFATLEALGRGWLVFGIRNGFGDLRAGSGSALTAFTKTHVGGIGNRGGSILGTSRASLKDPKHAQAAAAILSSRAECGVFIGGDDTLRSCNDLARAMAVAGRKFGIIHVPKTIDNDLPLGCRPTFGFRTAVHKCARELHILARDAKDCGNRYFLAIVMGRYTGHLAVEAARHARASAVFIPEMFERKLELGELAERIKSAVLQRKTQGHGSGVIVVAEGMFECLTESSQHSVASNLSKCEHSHIELATVPFGAVLRDAVERALAAETCSIKVRTVDLGFTLRAIPPVKVDREYTEELGRAAVALLADGVSEATVIGKGKYIPFSEMIGSDGTVSRRCVDISRYADILKKSC